jgi:hypothetical protein
MVYKMAQKTAVITIGTKVELTGLSAATGLNVYSGVVLAELTRTDDTVFASTLDNERAVYRLK